MVKSACFMRSFARGNLLCLLKRCRAFPPPTEISRTQSGQREAHGALSLARRRETTTLLLINRYIARIPRGPGQRAKRTAVSTAQRGGRRVCDPAQGRRGGSGCFGRAEKIWGGFSSRS